MNGTEIIGIHGLKSVVLDETIQYMTDFLNWLPSYNPETKVSHKGLNYYGVTVINKLGAEKLIKILDKWLELIGEAPDTFSLRGDTIGKKKRMKRATGNRREIG